MKNLTMLTCLLLLTACGNDGYISVPVEKEVLVPTEVFKVQDLEGFYSCDNYSQIEFIVDFYDRVTFETTAQSLNSYNKKTKTYGTHPLISDRDVILHNNVLVMAPRNYTYSSSTNALEEDKNGANITGSRRTDILVEMTGIDTVKINIKIFDGAVNSNINKVVADRTILCER